MSNVIERPDGKLILPTNADPAAAGCSVIGFKRYSVGVDLGGRGDDPSALVVVKAEQRPYMTGRGFEQALTPPEYTVVFTETLNTPEATDTVDWLAKRLGQLRNWRLLVDQSGLGGPVVSMIEQAGIAVTGVTMTAGAAISQKGNSVNVSKNLLFENTSTVLEGGQLIIAHDLPEKEELINECMSIQLTTTSSGNTVLASSGRGHHADRFVALSLAILGETHLTPQGMSFQKMRGYFG